MASILVTDIDGQNIYSVSGDDDELSDASYGFDSILSSVSGLGYSTLYAWVKDSGGPDGSEGVRSLNCFLSDFTYNGEECPSESDVDTLISAIETALEGDSDITSVNVQIVSSFISTQSLGQIVSVNSNLWCPGQQGSDDDEFDRNVIDSNWSVYNYDDDAAGSLSYGTVDAYDNTFNSGNNIRVLQNNPMKRSWLLMQPPASDKNFLLYKPYTFPTNVLVMARLKFNQKISTVNNDNNIGIGFYQDNSGKPYRGTASGYCVEMYLNESDTNAIEAFYQKYEASLRTTGGSTDDVDAKGQALEYVAIHKIGTTFHGWVGTASGNWVYLRSLTFTGTLAYVAIMLENADTTPGAKILGIDFIRFINTDNFLY